MTEEDFYKNNRYKVKLNDVSTWKYFPVGGLKRKIYDYQFLQLNEFLSVYYINFSNKELWDNQWIKAIVLPAFENDTEKLSRRLGIGITNVFSVKKMREFYSEIKTINYLDNDVKLFLSWMNGMSFFKNQDKKFEDWISDKNYNIGGRHQIKADLYSLKKIAQQEYGNNLVRDKLMELEWHKR